MDTNERLVRAYLAGYAHKKADENDLSLDDKRPSVNKLPVAAAGLSKEDLAATRAELSQNNAAIARNSKIDPQAVATSVARSHARNEEIESTLAGIREKEQELRALPRKADLAEQGKQLSLAVNKDIQADKTPLFTDNSASTIQRQYDDSMERFGGIKSRKDPRGLKDQVADYWKKIQEWASKNKTPLLYGAGGLAGGAALTYLLTRSAQKREEEKRRRARGY